MGKVKLMKKKLLFFIIVFMFITANLFAASPQSVYVVPVEETIDPGLAQFVERSYQEANDLKVDRILLEIDTPGGLVDAALQIKETINNSTIPTTAFVKGGAISAGALITLACDDIAMQPGATIGDAEPRVGSERADEKFVSYFAKEMAATAQVHGRDKDIAVAMVDRDAEIPGLVEKGKLLTLTYLEAKEVGYTDYIIKDRAELLHRIGLADAKVIEAKPSFAESLTRFITSPYISPFLLMIGIAGIIIEIFTFGFGIAGIIGIASLALYFGGHFLAGFTGWEAILLFLLGIILLGVEIVAPGFGIPGIAGIVSIFISIILTAPSWEIGVMSLVFAIIGTVVILFFSFKVLKKRNFWDTLVLRLKYKKEDGYIPQKEENASFVGKTGIAHTMLRPAGTVILDDGSRLDVVTEGGFIAQGERIEVIQVEGMRIIVRLMKNN